MQASGFVILTTEGRKDLSFIERLALRHRLRRGVRCTSDRSFPAFAGTAMLLPRNWGVSVGTNLTIAQGDHKDRPYPRFLLYQGRKAAWGSQDDMAFAQQLQRTSIRESTPVILYIPVAGSV